jgi:hypothetical protein
VHAVSLCLEDAKLAKLQRAASHFGYSTSNKSGAVGKLLDSFKQIMWLLFPAEHILR